ncbi:MAG: hypothetical protein WCC94_01215 [Candidatus Bathyarchaeia archaeon]
MVDAFESGIVDLPDFYFTGDDYRYRFELEAKQRFLNLLRERFNSPVSCKGRAFKWDTVIEQKTVELGRFLIGRSATVDFSDPLPILKIAGDRELRQRILSLSGSEAYELRIGRSTLHYLRMRAGEKPELKIYHRVRSLVA